MIEIIIDDQIEEQIKELKLDKKVIIDITEEVMSKAFSIEKIPNNLYMSVHYISGQEIKKLNHEYRNIDKSTDVLSFPMYEKDELKYILGGYDFEDDGEKPDNKCCDVLGDILINLEQIQIQAVEYGNTFKRELAYILVHGFYHILGEDHIEEQDKLQMREKEEKVLSMLNIKRGTDE